MYEKRSNVGKWLRRGAAGVLSLLMLFSLIQPGLAGAEQNYICGKEAHTHVDACYETKTETVTTKVLKCSLDVPAPAAEDGETAPTYVHAHNDDCYEGEDLVCPLEEIEAHTHEASCYGTEYQCGKKEVEAHQHSDACQKELICTETAEDHEHVEACWKSKECALEETEGHAHSEACGYNLICEKPVVVLHSHEETCYAPVTVAEGEEEQEPKLTCTTPVVENHVHDKDCWEEKTEEKEVKTLICGKEEHEHTDACVKKAEEKDEEKKPAYTCGKEEHTHGEGCYDEADVLTCTLEEHTHTGECSAPVKCGICEGEHADADCTVQLCEVCGVYPCECDIEEEIEEEEAEPYIRPSGFINAAGLVSRPQPAAYGLRRFMRSTPLVEDGSVTKSDPNVITSKTVSQENGQYTLTLESYIKAGTNTEDVPVDIVLVLDQSGSMRACFDHGSATCGICRIGILYLRKSGDINAGQFRGSIKNADDTHKEYTGAITKNNNGIYASGGETYIKTSKEYYCYNYNEGGRLDLVIYCDHLNQWVWKKGHNTTTHEGGKLKTDGDDERAYCMFFPSDFNSKRKALMDAVDSFLTAVKTDATTRQVANRVAIVGFSQGSSILAGDVSTALKTITNPNDENALRTAVANLGSLGITRTDLGVETATEIFNAAQNLDGETVTRNKVMVVFTDGEPTRENADGEPDNSDHFNKDTANAAIAKAKLLKDQNTSVYVIGIFDDADGGTPSPLPSYNSSWGSSNYVGDKNKQARINATNRFAHVLSSNYMGATNMSNTGSVNENLEGKSYFLAPENQQKLIDAFKQIASNLAEDDTLKALNSQADLVDVVAPSFFVDNENGRSITAQSFDYAGEVDGVAQWAATPDEDEYSINKNGRTVTVTGFNYYGNRVGYVEKLVGGNKVPVYQGKKLVVEIPIAPNPDFLGGNGVPTNVESTEERSSSGLYDKGDVLVEDFKSPNLNIPMKVIEPVFKTGHIYVGEQAIVPHIANVGHFKYVSGTDANGAPVYTETDTDSINNGYAKIIYILKDAEGHTRTYELPAGTDHDTLSHDDIKWQEGDNPGLNMTPLLRDDAEYTVSIQVVPSTQVKDSLNQDPEQAKNPIERQEEIWVYKPHITFNDSIMDYGQTANYEDATDTEVAKNFISVEWYHGEVDEDNKPNINEMGTAPKLTFTYSPVEGAFREETAVQVTAVVPSNTKTITDGAYEHMVPLDTYQNLIDPDEPANNVFFYRNGTTCSFGDCDKPGKSTVTPVKPTAANQNPTWTNFVVHLKSYDVTIAKKMEKLPDGKDYTDLYGTYKVDVEIKSNSFQKDMVINYTHGNGSTGTYTVTQADIDNNKTVTLKDITVEVGKPATIKRVPYDATYKIKETSGYGYQASYGYVVTENNTSTTITTGVNVGPGATGTVSNTKKTTEDQPNPTPIVINITKNLPNPDKKEHTFGFRLVQVDAQGNILYKQENTPLYQEDISITMKGEEKTKTGSFTKLVYETKDLAGGTVSGDSMVKKFYYQITETTKDDGKTIDADESVYTAEVTLTGKQNELTAAVKISQGSTTVIKPVFNNTLLGTLTVKKSIYGGDANDNFKFQLKTDEKINGEFDYEKKSGNGKLTFVNGVAEFHLRDGESLTLYGLPHGLEVQVHEVGTDKYAEFYKVNSSITREGQTVKVDVESKGTTVKYINYEVTSSWLPQTGQLKWPVLVLAALGIGFIGFGFLTKKRKKNGK